MTIIAADLYYSILNQLTDSRLALFPAILTCKCACDVAVVSLLRGRTLGNSPTALRNAILEIHSKDWMQKQLRYLDDWQRYRSVYLTEKYKVFIGCFISQGMVELRLAEALPVAADPVPFAGVPSAR